MLNNDSTISIRDIARLLALRHSTNHSTILFLGARAGGLFRSWSFYKWLERSSSHTFHDLSQLQQFMHCYWVLDQTNFTQGDLDQILHAAFRHLSISDADKCLAELVKTAFFDIIISTNIDTMLEQAFASAQMHQPRDFHVFLPQHGFVEDIAHLETQPACILVKAYGDFLSQAHVITKSSSFIETHAGLRNFLISRLQGEVLVVGYDPLWDRAIGSLFPDIGKAFWYINEETDESDPILRALKKRKGQSIIGGDGGYDRFMTSLYWYIQRNSERSSDPFDLRPLSQQIDTTPLPSQTSVPTIPPIVHTPRVPHTIQGHHSSPTMSNHRNSSIPVSSPSQEIEKKKVCLFYSKKDDKYLKELMIHFEPYERNGLIAVWNDTKIAPGHKWFKEIQEALITTKVAILLVSASFLASSFIAENILPPLLQAADDDGTTIISVIVHTCLFDNTPLAQFKIFNDQRKALDSKRSGERERIWTDLVHQVLQQL